MVAALVFARQQVLKLLQTLPPKARQLVVLQINPFTTRRPAA